MWIAIILLCQNPSALSCQVLAKTDETFYSEQECQEAVVAVATDFMNKGLMAIPNCFQVGDSV